MSLGSKKILLPAAAVLVAGTGWAGAKVMQHAAIAQVPDPLIRVMNQRASIDQYLAQIIGGLRAADRNGDGLDAGDIKFINDRTLAQARARAIGQVLAQDFDGDFRVTRAELEWAFSGDGNRWNGRDVVEARKRRVESALTQSDANGDDVITLQEMAAASTSDYRPDRQLEELLALDPNRDGKLTAKELRVMAQEAFNRVDVDEDGELSEAEYAPVSDRVRDIRATQMAPACKLPQLPRGAKLVVYGGYEGDAISSVAVGGPDNETNLIDVEIEPGSQPLYVVLTSYESMVWRFRGATNRVSNVVISSSKSAPGGTPAAGVVGLPTAKVSFGSTGCPGNFHSTENSAAGQVIASIRAALNREPDTIFGSYSAQRISLPSGRVVRADDGEAKIPAGFNASLWREATRYWPAGLASVTPQQVISKARIERYKVLPSQMGLAQLAGSGAITEISSDRFRVNRPIAHMPPGMGGAHSVTLIFGKGVPVPPGDPVHSCIIREDGGQSEGAHCRKGY